MAHGIRFLQKTEVVVFCVVFVGVWSLITAYSHLKPRVYESTGVLRFLPNSPLISVDDLKAPWSANQGRRPIPTAAEIDFEHVARAVPVTERAAFMMPYGYGKDADVPIIAGLLRRNLTIVPIRLSLLHKIWYRHPDPRMAQLGADLFVNEIMTHHLRMSEEETARALYDLGIRAKQQALTVEELTRDLALIRERAVAGSPDATEFRKVVEEHERRLQINEDLLDNLNRRIRDTSARHTSSLHLIDRPVIPKPDAYLISPYIKNLRWRFAAAGILGVVAVMLVRWKIGSAKNRGRHRDEAAF
jgi:polysaccharide biosynthesis transport protein